MFREIPNGTLIEIPDNAFGFIYKCWIPPIGFGINSITGEVQATEIFKRSEIESEQYWERQPLPLDYNEKRKREVERQRFDKMYVDPYLEEIRIREWNRRLCGVWFWNNGKLIYITGVHYMQVNWWRFQGKPMDYRLPDRDSWYVVDYCIDDPECLGLNEIMNRKNGKTLRAGLVLFERTSKYSFHHGGIQSKKDDDAWEVFKKACVHPWRKLPHFFRPTYDLMKGDDPNDELRFFATAKRGERAESEEPEEALDSFIDFKASGENEYDGPELHTYVSDETSKTKKDVSIKERQNVTRYCSELMGEFYYYANGMKIKNFHYYTTTVEISEDEDEHPEFQEMTAMSNPLNRDPNGRTLSGLYTYFRPAHHSIRYDKYGNPDIEWNKNYLLNTRKKLIEEGKLRELASFKRKQPMTFAEAFSIDGEKALFNPELVNNQLESFAWKSGKDSPVERGNLEWINGDIFYKEKKLENGEVQIIPGKLKWVDHPKGKYEKIKGWTPKEANNVFFRNGYFVPGAVYAMRMGGDPFKYDKTKDKRRSNCAVFGYQMYDELDPDSVYNDMLTMRYVRRAESTDEQNQDILEMAWWCGTQVLMERNVDHWKKYFESKKCAAFLMWLPGELEPGIYTDPKGNTVQLICKLTEAYIEKHIGKVFWKTLMVKETGWLGFKVEDTQKFDEPMGAGITLIAAKVKRGTHATNQNKFITDYFNLYKVPA